MGLYFDSTLIEIIISAFFLKSIIAIYYIKSFTYWENRGFQYLIPSFPYGNMRRTFLRKKNIGIDIADFYNEMKQKGMKYGGYFMLAKPILLAVDPEFIKQIMIKDFNSFQDRGVYADEQNDPLSAHLFAIGGQKWRALWTKLSPTFTSGKMKMMFQTLVDCGNDLDDLLVEINQRDEPIDIKDISARFTTDVIANCVFGLKSSSLKNPDDEFRKEGKRIFHQSVIEGIKVSIGFIMPSLLKFFRLKLVKPETTKFMMDIVKQTIDYREKNNIQRKDFLDLLIKLKKNQAIDDDNPSNVPGITMNELAAQCFVFFLGGVEPSSTTMTWTLFELCEYQDIQEKLRKEIRATLAKHGGEITYEAVQEMQYLDKVVNETLRKYPAIPMLNRECNNDWTIPGTKQIIEKGTQISISNYGLQMDPEYYPDAETFDPERFSEEEKAKRPALTYLPFGDGPRNCLGMRFGLMQTKVGLITFLKNYKFTLDSKTVLPIAYDEKLLTLSHKEGIWLNSTRA